MDISFEWIIACWNSDLVESIGVLKRVLNARRCEVLCTTKKVTENCDCNLLSKGPLLYQALEDVGEGNIVHVIEIHKHLDF